MTGEGSARLPPRWAESLLRLVLSTDDRDSVSGDLLEEYRESIAPALDSRADRWYVRQVAGYVVRKAWMWGALAASILVTRYLFDSLVPVRYTPGVVHPRSAIMSDLLIATFVLSAAWRSWRSGHVRSGVLVAVVAAAFGGVLSAAGTAACLTIWHDPDTLRAVQGSGGLAEALWFVPLLLVPIGLITGIAGAVAGRLVHAIVDRGSNGRLTLFG